MRADEPGRIPGTWWPVEEAPARLGPSPGEAILRWLHDDVSAPRPELGRPGALCPFVPVALRHRLIFATVAAGHALAEVLERQATAFHECWPADDGTGGRRPSLLVVMPDVGYPTEIKEVVHVVKPRLLEHGLTCGEFYPGSDDRSARSRAVLVASSPVALVALRHLTRHDELFLRSQPEYAPIYDRWAGRA